MEAELINKLHSAFNNVLPGRDAHLQLSPGKFRKEYYDAPSSHKQAAVLAILFYKEEQLYIIYMKRSSYYQADKHAGQISFPGGQLIVEDENLEHCALRETNEEIGLQSNDFTIVGKLSPIYVFVSNFLVQPFLAVHRGIPDYILDPKEVDSVIEAPVKELLDSNSLKKKDILIRNTTLKDVPYFNLSGEVLWGATAMITNEILAIIKKDIIK